MLNAIAFAVLSFLVILGAVMMINTRNVLHAAYWLLEVAIVTAAILWFLGAEYIAVVQLLVYAGSVGVLVIFTLMVTFRTRHELYRESEDNSLYAFLVSLALLALITYAILFSPAMTRVLDYEYQPLRVLGIAMFNMDGWVLPFELVSLVLTVALVAAVWRTKETSSKRKKDGE